jgi:hypothetical protein
MGREIGHRNMRIALIPSHALSYTDFLAARASGVSADLWALGRGVDLVA